MDPKSVEALLKDTHEKNKHQASPPTKESDVLNFDEARKYFAGCALMGMLSECRLGANLSKGQMDDVCNRAAYMGNLLAEKMC
jgi:hypothetical protein